MGKRNGNKMKASSVQSNEFTTIDSSSFVENSVLSDTLSEENQSSGLTQSMNNLTVDDSDPRFQVPVDTVLFYPDRKDRLFKLTVKSYKTTKLKSVIQAGDHKLMNGCAHDPFGHTLNLAPYCQTQKDST